MCFGRRADILLADIHCWDKICVARVEEVANPIYHLCAALEIFSVAQNLREKMSLPLVPGGGVMGRSRAFQLSWVGTSKASGA